MEERHAYLRFLRRCTFYTGTETQLPDASIVAVQGVGNVSAFRGLTYIVVTHDDLTEMAGAIPQYEFCVDATLPDVYLTSLPYPQDIPAEALTLPAPESIAVHVSTLHTESGERMQIRPALAHGELRDCVVRAGATPDACMMSPSLVGITLQTCLHALACPQESFTLQASALVGGRLEHGYVQTQMLPEALRSQAPSLVGGNLTS